LTGEINLGFYAVIEDRKSRVALARNFYSLAIQVARTAERAQRANAREHARQAREAQRADLDRQRQNKRSYQEARAAEIEAKNSQLSATYKSLESILVHALEKPTGINWEALSYRVNDADLDEFPSLKLIALPSTADYKPQPPHILSKLIPGWKQRFNRKIDARRREYETHLHQYSKITNARKQKLGMLQAEADKHNQQLHEFRAAYHAGNPDAVAGFFELIFERSAYPDGFPARWKLAYLAESKQLVVEFDLPTLDEIIPTVERYKYTKSTDQIVETKKPQKLRQSLYTSIVAQAVLRRMYEVFAADQDQVVDVATLSGFVEAIDPGTGQSIRPCLISVRATRDDVEKLDFQHVDPIVCLKRLNAAVSREPSELVAVKPILDINMSDPRFIQESDVLSTLDNRPNLMELTPGEFENLITNLFQRMGLETKLTQASRDGGVDCVAFDPRPVLGGKVVVQAKRYRNTVGVSAVRDLFGTMHNEGASKGILVTTSGYGKAAYEFANGKPIELLSGSNLIYLLKEHAGIDAKIVVPSEWRDP
jgi:restriction system protein